MSQTELIESIVRAASSWQEPDYPTRAEAVRKTLDAPNRFTEEAIAFAINQQMSLLTSEALQAWAGGRRANRLCRVGVLNAGNIPFVGLQDFLAVILTGHAYLGSVSSQSPYLVPYFVDEVKVYAPELPARFLPVSALFKEAEAVIAMGSDETIDWAAMQCEAHGIAADRRLLRGHRISIAVLDGREIESERDGLAEDVLLHEGRGCRNVALIWAPRGLDPDPYLESFAAFRSVFPAHVKTPGTLKMQQALLEAVDFPHAYGDGLEFLMSRGDPEVQPPGHVRWVEYDHVDDVVRWIRSNVSLVQLVLGRQGLADQLPGDVSVERLGEAQRPPLKWKPDGIDTLEFLGGLQ